MQVNKPFLALLTALFLATVLIGGAFAYRLFYGAAILTLISFYLVQRALTEVIFIHWVDKREITVGEEVAVRLKASNSGFWPVPLIILEDRLPIQLKTSVKPRFAVTLSPFATAVFNYRLTCERRGVYRLGPVEIRVFDFLGIFSGKKDFSESLTITALPRLVPLSYLPLSGGEAYGRFRRRRRTLEDLTSSADIRRYRPGDPWRKIHWKVTAHRGELFSREFERRSKTDLVIFLDMQAKAYEDLPEDLEERAVECALAVVHYGLRHKMSVDLFAHGLERVALSGKRPGRLPYIRLALTALKADGKIPLDELIKREGKNLAPEAELVLITPRLSNGLYAELLTQERLGRRGLILNIIPTGTPAGERREIFGRFRLLPLHSVEELKLLGGGE